MSAQSKNATSQIFVKNVESLKQRPAPTGIANLRSHTSTYVPHCNNVFTLLTTLFTANVEVSDVQLSKLPCAPGAWITVHIQTMYAMIFERMHTTGYHVEPNVLEHSQKLIDNAKTVGYVIPDWLQDMYSLLQQIKLDDGNIIIPFLPKIPTNATSAALLSLNRKAIDIPRTAADKDPETLDDFHCTLAFEIKCPSGGHLAAAYCAPMDKEWNSKSDATVVTDYLAAFSRPRSASLEISGLPDLREPPLDRICQNETEQGEMNLFDSCIKPNYEKDNHHYEFSDCKDIKKGDWVKLAKTFLMGDAGKVDSILADIQAIKIRDLTKGSKPFSYKFAKFNDLWTFGDSEPGDYIMSGNAYSTLEYYFGTEDLRKDVISMAKNVNKLTKAIFLGSTKALDVHYVNTQDSLAYKLTNIVAFQSGKYARHYNITPKKKDILNASTPGSTQDNIDIHENTKKWVNSTSRFHHENHGNKELLDSSVIVNNTLAYHGDLPEFTALERIIALNFSPYEDVSPRILERFLCKGNSEQVIVPNLFTKLFRLDTDDSSLSLDDASKVHFSGKSWGKRYSIYRAYDYVDTTNRDALDEAMLNTPTIGVIIHDWLKKVKNSMTTIARSMKNDRQYNKDEVDKSHIIEGNDDFRKNILEDAIKKNSRSLTLKSTTTKPIEETKTDANDSEDEEEEAKKLRLAGAKKQTPPSQEQQQVEGAHQTSVIEADPPMIGGKGSGNKNKGGQVQ